jgi:hypothetical protein
MLTGGSMTTQSSKRPVPVALLSITAILFLVTFGAIGGIGYGFYTHWLDPYWQNLTDAHAAILSQLIFFLAAAWASVLVPLLFREQLRTMEDAAKRAENLMLESATQFKHLVRFQIASMGHLLDEQLRTLETPEERKFFIDSKWEKADEKVKAAIALLHGNQRNVINGFTKGSGDWWQRVRDYNALGDHYEACKTIYDRYRKFKANLTFEDLQAVNEAALRLENFVPSKLNQAVQAANASVAQVTAISPPPNGNGAGDELRH